MAEIRVILAMPGEGSTHACKPAALGSHVALCLTAAGGRHSNDNEQCLNGNESAIDSESNILGLHAALARAVLAGRLKNEEQHLPGRVDPLMSQVLVSSAVRYRFGDADLLFPEP
ncbi:hypothetical protein E2C01_060669 [Portunus trituberculatus]|uniref:Uncharacterized protein n=1 Tax=Portunus trituberculatus TaxID=210409 RepID=A0A5B7H1T9_PORTR|nr:hypothetical protein [Portunus trituberculatus]